IKEEKPEVKEENKDKKLSWADEVENQKSSTDQETTNDDKGKKKEDKLSASNEEFIPQA
ncbi:hypothetical protein KI387_004970, partial [Taxus chinensis]